MNKLISTVPFRGAASLIEMFYLIFYVKNLCRVRYLNLIHDLSGQYLNQAYRNQVNLFLFNKYILEEVQYRHFTSKLLTSNFSDERLDRKKNKSTVANTIVILLPLCFFSICHTVS